MGLLPLLEFRASGARWVTNPESARLIALSGRMWLRGRCEGDRTFGGKVEKGECFLQVQADMRVGMAQVADGGILANVKIQVPAAGCDHKGSANGRRPNNFAVDQALDMF